MWEQTGCVGGSLSGTLCLGAAGSGRPQESTGPQIVSGVVHRLLICPQQGARPLVCLSACVLAERV